MTPSRRDFIRTASFAGGLSLLDPRTLTAHTVARTVTRSDVQLRILILGGTGFIGPHHVNYAVARGHRVSIFNRGRQSAGVPDGVEQLIGDRNGDLRALEGREWDAVIDLPTTLPKWVRDAGNVLKERTPHYTFISTLGVNAQFDRDTLTTDGPVQQYRGEQDPFSITEVTGALYGPLKAISEQEAERQFPGKALIVRPGLIVGPGDPTDRFSYWPIRMERGGEVLAPGNPTDPVQLIDARDLAEWVIRNAEARTTGVFNLTGPAQTLTIAEMLGAVRGTYGAPMRLTWVPSDFLLEQGVEPWHGAAGPLPLWTPTKEVRALMRADISGALEHGLTFRPLADTSRDTVAWHHTRPAERRAELRAGMSPERERELLDAWHGRAR
ncbi:MAG TPA: NAD-dependent epimerase/dehydratase family protein [Longimicrobiales bacterium]